MTASIEDIVRHKLPFLQSPADDTALDLEIVQSCYALQPYLNKTDIEVEDRAAYSALESMLVAYYTAYHLINRKALVALQGENGAEGEAFPVKKVKADVVETEFDTNAKNGKWMTSTQIMEELKSLICQTARTLKIRLPMCHKLKTIYIPFKVYH